MTDTPPHGTTYRYWAGCRCTTCTEAKRAYNTNRRRQKAYGRWTGLTPAHDTQQTIKTLHAAGITYNTIGRATGLTGVGIKNILTNTYVRQTTADAVAALNPNTLPTGRPCDVPSTGTIRRIEGLRHLGWDGTAIDKAAGLRPGASKAITAHRKPAVTRDTADAILRATRTLLTLRPPQDARGNRARTFATSKGYAPLMAWDDIDDPDETPQLDAPTAYRELAYSRTDPELIARVWRLKDSGLTDREISAEVGVLTPPAVCKLRARYPRGGQSSE